MKARMLSPPDLFMKLMKQRLAEDSDVQFYLATDSSEVEDRIISEFADHVITQKNKSIERDTKDGAINSFIDMLCLSKTEKIYGSAHSTFSGIAAHIGGIEKVTVRI